MSAIRSNMREWKFHQNDSYTNIWEEIFAMSEGRIKISELPEGSGKGWRYFYHWNGYHNTENFTGQPNTLHKGARRNCGSITEWQWYKWSQSHFKPNRTYRFKSNPAFIRARETVWYFSKYNHKRRGCHWNWRKPKSTCGSVLFTKQQFGKLYLFRTIGRSICHVYAGRRCRCSNKKIG